MALELAGATAGVCSEAAGLPDPRGPDVRGRGAVMPSMVLPPKGAVAGLAAMGADAAGLTGAAGFA